MKLFQQLLVAPAALGLLAPVVAQAADLNLNGVNQYAASSQDQVTSITQFSDVRPTDWAYQALSNLISRYGCVAGYPNGTFKGGQAMTRYEAAALLNACLDRISDTTDELKRLVAEFSKELAVLRGRVDGLEAKVGELQATQFSTTTKLKGLATMVLGASTYSSNNFAGASAGYNIPGGALTNGLTFNYDVRLNFDTSFTGKDLLRTTLRAGNAGQSAFGFNNAVTTATALETFFQDPTIPGGTANNIVGINRLFYQFPLGKSFTATVGARVRQDDMLAMWPSVYPADTVLDMFTYAGSPVTYALNLGGGAGLWWRNGGFSVSANYVSANAGNGSPNQANAFSGNFGVNSGGVGTSASASSTTVQVGYAGNNYGLAAAYAYNQNLLYQATNAVNAAIGGNLAGGGLNSTNSLALSGYWQPSHNGWFPSLSAGWGIGTSQNLGANGTAIPSGQVLNSWTLGLQWADAFVKGNALGMGLGQNTMVSKNMYGGGTPNDGNWAWEWWY
ncbi:MAG: iron uptake porin, partial [Synechococcus sp. ELA057]